MQIEISTIVTPIGELPLAIHQDTLYALDFDRAGLIERLAKRFDRSCFVERNDSGKIGRVLAAYFEGDIDALDAIAVETGGTPFQKRVWKALRAIPSGTTVSYQSIATAAGSPGAVRAAGTANGANPIAVVIPCHRVIRSDLTLGGYGGGLDRKRWLLAHEKVANFETINVETGTRSKPGRCRAPSPRHTGQVSLL